MPQNVIIKLVPVGINKGSVLIADDRVVIAQTDTIVMLPVNIDYYIKKHNPLRNDSIYNKIREKAYKRRWTKEIHNLIINNNKHNNAHPDNLRTLKAENLFSNYKGLIVRNIKFVKLDVFGPTVFEPTREADSWLAKTANKLHIKTSDYVLNKNLIFKEGDVIDPFVLSDNERIYRDLPFIEDARVDVSNVNSGGDSADVTIYIKDVWSKGFDLNSSNLNTGYFDFWDSNILGTGQEWNNHLYRNAGALPYQGYDGNYNIRNIEGSFINARVNYSLVGSQGYGLKINRDFYTSKTRWAGAFGFQRMSTYQQLFDRLSVGDYYPVNFENYDSWFGTSVPIRQSYFKYSMQPSIIFSVGLFTTKYYIRPELDKHRYYPFQDKNLYLGSIAYSQQGYYRSNLVYSFGRTEDIPYGILLNFTTGFEKGEFNNRLYNCFKIVRGNYFFNLGYHYTSIAYGGFLNNTKFEQGMLKFNSRFFTNLIVYGSYKFRHFITLSYLKGFNRFDEEKLDLNNYNGIRGFESAYIYGNEKINANFETVTFTPLYVLGFRFALFGFADLGMLDPNTNNTLYTGYGAGVRIRNEKLVFKTLQFRFSEYPNIPNNASGRGFYFDTVARFNLENFFFKGPEILVYR